MVGFRIFVDTEITEQQKHPQKFYIQTQCIFLYTGN